MVAYPENLTLGNYVDIGAFTYIQAQHGVVIEDNAQIGSHCAIYSANTIDGVFGKVVIRDNAKIGANSVVLPGVTIGREAKIGACSLVKRDVPAGSIYCGVPARPRCTSRSPPGGEKL